ncbi:MAG: hypothetical protein R3F10_01075 [Lysobacteraceae bacterium]
MTRFLELVISVLIVVVLFVVVGLFLPSRQHVTHMAETNHPVRQVYDTLNGFGRFGDWHPLRQHDPTVKYTVSGAPAGVGAQLDYNSWKPEIGKGTFLITESVEDEKVEFVTENQAYGTGKRHRITLEPRGKIVNITWRYDVDYGWNIFGRYAGLYLDRTVGDDMKRGLNNFTGLLATMPNYDYRALDVAVTELPPQNILFVSTSADRNITAVENAMIEALKDIRSNIVSNGLVETGGARLITTNFGTDKYTFDIAIPVARKDAAAEDEGDDASAEEEAPGDGSETQSEVQSETVAAPVVDLAPPAPLEGLKLPENVQLGVSYGGRVVTAPYTGHPAALPLIRDQLRSYAAAHGLQLQDRSIDEYLTEIEDTSAEEARFRVYWPIK